MTAAAARTVTALAARQLRRGTLVLAGVVAGMSALVVVQYRATFADAVDLKSLESLAGNPAIRTLFGTPVALDEPGGFMVWRIGTFVGVTVGVWALLAATRVTRGEEDAGRWALLLAGPVHLRGVVARHLVALGAAALLVGAAAAAALVAISTDVRGALLYGGFVGLTGVFFAATGGLAAQVVADRRGAAALALAVLAVALLVRMIGDGVESLRWLLWASPFGLLARSRPYADDAVLPLAVLAAACLAVGWAACWAAGRRDVGAGLVRSDDQRPARLRLLRSLPRFAVRRVVRSVLGWAAGIGAYFLLIGLLADAMVDFLADNRRFAEMAAEAGFGGLASVEGYAAALFGLLPLPLGIFMASRVSAHAADERERRSVLLLALPIPRLRWLAAEAAVAVVAALALALVAGTATWLGTAAVGAGLGLGPALTGALNAVPVAVLGLGAAVCALGWAPDAVLAIGSVPLAGGFLLKALADSFGWPSAVAAFSPFEHLAAVPSSPPDWAGAAGVLAVAVGLAAVGAIGYARRDLRG